LKMGGAPGSLQKIELELQKVLGRRERILKDSRDVILASSRAIVALHGGKTKEAEEEISRARSLLKSLRKDGEGSLSRYLISPETEYVEASTVDAIVRGKPIPDSSVLEVSPEAYILGLLDSVGEIKRLLLVSITEGKIDKAKDHFKAMERLYSLLSPFAVFDNVVSGVRRKIDVARMIIEDTRGILAEETRRDSLLLSIKKLQKTMRGRDEGSKKSNPESNV
jgi:translin